MIGFSAVSSNAVQQRLCRAVMDHGQPIDPRGMATRELLGASFVLEEPRNRLTTLASRRWSASLAVAELAWNVRGDSTVGALAFYSEQWLEFADSEGLIRGSCYGAKVFGDNGAGRSQWENVRQLLISDPSSRRAVLSFRDELDVSATTSDLSCTNTIQFLMRDGKLHAFVNMRSNDVIWGIPYDIFLFTTLQEQMSLELGVELGDYHHTAASMHIYERHFETARAIADELASDDVGSMPAIQDVDALTRLAAAEEMLRARKAVGVPQTPYEALSLDLLQRHRRLKRVA